jgi:hypothetical protein
LTKKKADGNFFKNYNAGNADFLRRHQNKCFNTISILTREEHTMPDKIMIFGKDT